MKNWKRSLRGKYLFVLGMAFFVMPLIGGAQEKLPPIEANLDIPVPFVEFSKPVQDDSGLTVGFIGEYISGVYQFLISIVGIVAAAMILLGGYQYLTAGGSQEKVAGAKKRIVNALMGLVLVLGSYLVLFTLNPNLVAFNALKLTTIDTITFQGSSHDDDDQNPSGENSNTDSGEFKVKGFFKSDPELAKKNRLVNVNLDLFGTIDFATTGRRSLSSIKHMVVHQGGYSAKGNINTWQSACRKTTRNWCTGAHYTISRDGTIYQHINEEAVAIHGNNFNKTGVGIELNFPGWPNKETKYLCKGKLSNTISCNSISKSKCNIPDDKLPEVIRTACTPTQRQYGSLFALTADLIARTGIKLTNDSIVGHCESHSGAHGDPRAFDWSKLGLSNADKKADLSKRPSGHACSWYLPF